MIESNPTKQQLFYLQHGKCFYCANWIYLNSATKDHVVPLKRMSRKKQRKEPRYIQGQTQTIGNIVLACKHCNLQKGSRDPTESELKRRDNLYRVAAHVFHIRWTENETDGKRETAFGLSLHLHAVPATGNNEAGETGISP